MYLSMDTYKDLVKGNNIEDMIKNMNTHIFKPEDIKEIKLISKLPIIIKGVMSAEDA